MRSLQADVRNAMRTVWGAVAAGGTISNPGSGDWIVRKTATGVYLIKFLTPFRLPVSPVVVSSTWNITLLADYSVYTTDRVQVLGFVSSTPTDGAFSFSVTGRPR